MNKNVYTSPVFECEKIVSDFLMNSAGWGVLGNEGESQELYFDAGFFDK